MTYTTYESDPYTVARCVACGLFQPIGSNGDIWPGSADVFMSNHECNPIVGQLEFDGVTQGVLMP